MPLPAYRAKQSTATTGTGTLALLPATATGASLAAVYGAARRVQYVISWASGYELGLGDFDGASPGALTRATVLRSSNAGALVSLPAGVKDVFIALMPRQAEIGGFSATATLQLADLGGLVVFDGTAGATLNLPAFASVPLGAAVSLHHRGAGIVTIDPAGAETVNAVATVQLYPGETCELVRHVGGWLVLGLANGWRQVAASVSASVQAVVVFALPTALQRFRLELEDVAASVAAVCFLRLSFDGGSTYAAGASDYGNAYGAMRSAGLVAGGSATTFLGISDSTGTDIFGAVEFRAQGSKRLLSDVTSTTGGVLSRLVNSGNCAVAGTATHLQLGFVSTTVAAHRIRLLGIA